MADHVCGGDDDEATMTRQELEHSRVPCFHAHCRCDTKLPNPDNHLSGHPRVHHPRQHGHHIVHREPHRYNGDHGSESHHNHHHTHHHHHHHHNELHSSSSSSSSPKVTTSRSFQVGSLHRLLTLFVFLLAWAAVCGAPRRTSDGSLSRYNPETEHTNSLFFDHDSSHPMAAISSVEALLQPPREPSHDENGKGTTAAASTAASASASASLNTGSEPAMRVQANNIPSPLDSMNMPGIFPGFISQRVAFSVERPQTPPWPGDISFKPQVMNEEGASANTTDESEVAHSRRRRSSSISDLEEVCESTSGWVVKKWGTDMYGQNVTILSEIMTAGNIQVTQWFYETACARPHGVQTCLGIDNNNYDSLCLTKSAWVYAMIRTSRGEEGWTWIAISSSCNCAVRRLSILEQMQRRRLTRLEGFR